MKQRIDINAVLLAIYIWMFMVLRIVWSFNPNYSTLILGILAFTIVIVSILKSENFSNLRFYRGLALISIIIFFLLLDILFRNNEVIFIRLYEFIIYGVIPIVLFSQIKNFKSFFQTYIIISIIIFLVYVADPLNNYYFSDGYMVYGFQAMLPAFFGLHLGRKVFNFKFLLIFEIISIAMIIMFGNRMAGIAAIVFILIIDIFYKKRTLLKSLKYFSFMIIGAVLIINIKPIIEFITNYLADKGYSSYSINSMLYYLNGTIDNLSSGRDVLWNSAIELIKESPIFGYGVGYFESVNNLYVHNFIFEILLSYGLLGLIFYLLLLVRAVYNITKSEGYKKLFGLLLLCTAFPKLFTSIYIFIEPAFWMLLSLGLNTSLKKSKKGLIKEGEVHEK
ncbi:O-antigen polymerase [Sutcliffiella sp. NC1]|uniref:O-antigen polymerase n=1 Tax=Sutcliffiella sp. NC1 TaxID=3004096 RepID=UPI0022DD634E|nr:O-antigen polymerase [Sutcliffiella sp. NC1]WBL14824.1 O-antigen ligase [Sutcliffiella sp. NC1]